MKARPLPPPESLTWDQSAGRACVWCAKLLTTGAVHAGTVRDQLGAHNLDTEVWACPPCDAARGERRPDRPARADHHRGEVPSAPGGDPR